MAGEEILVVEDDTTLLAGLSDILELAGFRVSTAHNGQEGLARFREHPSDLVISDIMMPLMDGYQFFEAVRALPEGVGVPFIFLTAKGDKADIRRGKQMGADDYLVKPFEEEDLLVAIRARLHRHAQLEAARDLEIADLKRTILTTLNHEFRTPLTYITAYTDVLRTSEPDLASDEFRNLMRGIQVGSERLRRLVEDFLLLVELQTGEAQKNFERRREIVSYLPSMLHAVLARHENRAAERRVRLISKIPPSLPAVWVDREYLSSAVSRLVENGVKFSKKEGGQVTLSACPGEGRVYVEVKDDGIGMRAEALAKIFDMLYQIDRAKMEQQGSGSGLAIARGIASMHGGTLTVASEYGVGSTFSFDLPIASGP